MTTSILIISLYIDGEMATSILPLPSLEDVQIAIPLPSLRKQKQIEQFKMNARLDAIHLRDTSCNKLMRVIAYSAATTGSPTENVKVRRREQIHGIEHLISPEVLKTLYTQRRKTIKRVLQVQEAQRRGIIDPALTTAKISEINSSFSKAWSSRITKFQHGESDRVESTARCA